MEFQFCWENRDCSKSCPVKTSKSIFCWRIARAESLCHPDICAQCSYRRNWFEHKYSLQEFIDKHDRRQGRQDAKRILAIDDEPNFLYGLEETILSNGYRCLTAVDGEEGLLFAQEVLPHLIITDIIMPKINGFELLQTLKENTMTRHIPVIIATVRGAQKDIDEGMRLGAQVYLLKPFQPSELEEHIKTLLLTSNNR